MPRFTFTARDGRGELRSGELDGASAEAVASQLVGGGLVPVRIDAVTVRERGKALPALPWSQRVTLDDLILFSRQMFTLSRAGVPIIRSLRGLVETTRNPRLMQALDEVREGLEAGRDLSGAMGQRQDVFPLLFSSIIQVGEGTGRIDESFRQIGSYLERERDLRKQVRSALRYPLFVICAVALAVAILSLFVIPAFEKLFQSMRAELPLPTRIILGVSHFSVTYWPWLLVASVAAVLAIRAWVNTPAGRMFWDRQKLRLPLAGSIVLRATLARFARAFALGYSAGVPLIQSLVLAGRAVGNVHVEDRVTAMQAGVERGETLTASAHRTGLFTPLVLQMLAVGEESGSVDSMLLEVAEYYEREVEYDLKALSSAIEPIMIVILGGMVLVLALGVFLPLWNMASLARGGG